ncbi:L-lactate MFS transporter [Lacticigenium naphthae]|uniref:L-lactate MFS transporter n=1 Tax=Lacticigenium naphthae TaxID=515351 RepID=UPI0003FCEB87|nr:OFA family MFS transporter [Lacticigenium naphthae]
MNKISQRWRVVFGAVLVQLCIGGIYTWSLFNQSLADAHDWETTQVYFAYSLIVFIFAFVTILSGRLQDRYGPKNIATVGIVLFSLGYILTGTADTLLALYLSYSVLAGIGVGFVYVCPLSTCVKWFPNNKGFITGIVVGAFGLGGFLFNSLIQQLIESVGVSRAFFYLGVLYGVLGLIGAQQLRLPEKKDQGIAQPFSKETEYSVKEMLQTKTFYMIWTLYLIGTISGLMVIGLARDIGMELVGLSGPVAAYGVATAALFNAVGRIFWGLLSDKIGRMRVITTLFILTAAVMSGFSLFSSSVPVYFFSIALIAFSFGGFLAVFPPLTSDFYGTHNLGANYGLVYQAYGLAALVGPFILANVGGFETAFTIAAILAGAGAILSLGVKPPMKTE